MGRPKLPEKDKKVAVKFWVSKKCSDKVKSCGGTHVFSQDVEGFILAKKKRRV